MEIYKGDLRQNTHMKLIYTDKYREMVRTRGNNNTRVEIGRKYKSEVKGCRPQGTERGEGYIHCVWMRFKNRTVMKTLSEPQIDINLYAIFTSWKNPRTNG